jgi:hypothetical protein
VFPNLAVQVRLHGGASFWLPSGAGMTRRHFERTRAIALPRVPDGFDNPPLRPGLFADDEFEYEWRHTPATAAQKGPYEERFVRERAEAKRAAEAARAAANAAAALSASAAATAAAVAAGISVGTSTPSKQRLSAEIGAAAASLGPDAGGPSLLLAARGPGKRMRVAIRSQKPGTFVTIRCLRPQLAF